MIERLSINYNMNPRVDESNSRIYFIIYLFMKKTNSLYIVIAFFLMSCNVEKQHDPLSVWHTSPADGTVQDNAYSWIDDANWLKAFPIGNGYMGAMVFGGVQTERIQLNNKNLWSGSFQDADNPNAYDARAEIRQDLFNNKNKEAQDKAQFSQVCLGEGTNRAHAAEKPFGCYQTLGDLYLQFNDKAFHTNYIKKLNLNDATVDVSYQVGSNNISRQYFASYPDNVIVVKLKSANPGGLTFNAFMNRPERFQIKEDLGQLVMSGSMNNGSSGDGLKYWVRMDAKVKGGEKKISDGKLFVSQADEVTLYLTSTTNYKGYPTYIDVDFQDNTKEILTSAMEKPYELLLDRHKKDYSSYYNRVELNLDNEQRDTIPTDIRISNVQSGQKDLHLQELLFQYGRYLLISSSREGTLPANLQGVWCNKITSAWNGDYHMDVNLQMNYWLAQVTNLPELFIPYVDYIESLQVPGKKTAQIHYKSEGWCVHPISNVWGFTSPGERVGWGSHIGAAGWICQNIWEQYAFTLDTAYLERIYPILKSTALFYSDWLVLHPETKKWVSTPSISPENHFYTPNMENVNMCVAAAHDQQVIWDLFSNYLKASSILSIKDSLVLKVEQQQKNLQGNVIGRDGRLMEWDKEYKEVDPGHRHISHLYAVFPGSQINKKTTELYTAARKSVDTRVENMKGSGVAWSTVWLISLAARFEDHVLANESIKKFITHSVADNLFSLGRPFQIEAGLGFTSGLAEMLLQSHTDELVLLPALPSDWKDGSVKGLCARGGYEVDLKWIDGQLEKCIITSKAKDGKVKLVYDNMVKTVILKKNEKKELFFSRD